MKRTVERVLSIISASLTLIGLILSFVVLSLWKKFTSNPVWRQEVADELLADPDFTLEDVEVVFSLLEIFEGFSWIIIIGLLISLLVTIIGIINIWNNKNPILAGVMFIIGGIFAGLLSVTSILLYVAGILCFTRKPPINDDFVSTEANHLHS